ncbi:MAG TPA: tyrosine--tRNA ligase [Terriglobales bacterium]|nr:tyrosine--tRNA ligase [Terriglobales bacterium]
MPEFAPVEEQLAYLRKGAADIIAVEELRQRLAQSLGTGVPLQVKAGFDPTAPDLHLGHTVLLRKLKHFQDLGHEVTFLIGDFTGLIGDPTGRSETRPALTPEQIQANAETYRSQVFRLLDPERTRVRFNSEWLGALDAASMVKLCAKYTVARMLERDDFQLRYRSGQPISIHEFLYPLAQAYDSVALRSDVELGGTDQRFNLLLGREIQREYGQPAQIVLTMPLLEGLDGVRKMSKSFGNYIGIAEPAETIFAKVMSVSDELMWRYYLLLTDASEGEIEGFKKLHPMDAKKRLAEQITRDFRGAAAARAARDAFERVVQGGAAPEAIADVAIVFSDRLDKMLEAAHLAPSVTEAARLIKSGAVSLDGEPCTTVKLPQPLQAPVVVKVGKHRFARLVGIAAGLLLLAVQLVGQSPLPRVTFSRGFKGSDPAFFSVAVNRDGKAVFTARQQDADPPVTIDFTATPAVVSEIFADAAALGDFSRPLQSKARVAYTGDKMLAFDDASHHASEEFTYTTIPAAAALTALFEKIGVCGADAMRLRHAMQYSRLDVTDIMDEIVADWDGHQLAEPQLLAPTLEQLVGDNSLMNSARHRAQKLLAQFPKN